MPKSPGVRRDRFVEIKIFSSEVLKHVMNYSFKNFSKYWE